MAYERLIAPAVQAYRPDVLLTQTGCDTYHDDPLTDLAASMALYPALAQRLHDLMHGAHYQFLIARHIDHAQVGRIRGAPGEYAGRRTALEQLAFFSGYGVEIGLLIDVFEKFGLSAIAQVDLLERIHHNQSLESLSKMSFAIIQAVIRKLERRYGERMLHDINKTMKLIRYDAGRFFLDVEEIAERERPAMIDLSVYREKQAGHGLLRFSV
jgi:hypothetical protein